MGNETDWRLFPEDDEQFSGLTLHRWRFHAKFPGDHDHCTFCSAKFMDADEPPRPDDTHVIVHEGYTTEDDQQCICDQCFADFRERFSWKLSQDSN
jgi:hypothetical protein